MKEEMREKEQIYYQDDNDEDGSEEDDNDKDDIDEYYNATDNDDNDEDDNDKYDSAKDDSDEDVYEEDENDEEYNDENVSRRTYNGRLMVNGAGVIRLVTIFRTIQKNPKIFEHNFKSIFKISLYCFLSILYSKF